MAGLSITGQMKVSTLQAGFLKEFGLMLRIYDGRSVADSSKTLSQVRKIKGTGKALSVAKNMKVGTLEDKFEKEFGLKVQVAGSDDSYLCKNELTLNAAQQEDEKKLGRKERKAARQDEASDDKSDDILNLDDYPESTHSHLAEIKRLSHDEKKSDEEIAEELQIDTMDIVEALMLIEMDMGNEDHEDEHEQKDEHPRNPTNNAEANSFKELTVLGAGGEIVIGTIESQFVAALKDVDADELNEDNFETITGQPWSEFDDIWHFYGPFEEFTLEDSVGNRFGCDSYYDWDWDENEELIENFTKKPVKNLWKLSISENYLVIVVNGEKGNWGKIKVPKDADIEQLEVISGDSEFDTEYCVTLGFALKDEILEWDQDGDTRGTHRIIKIFDIAQGEVILEF